MGRVPAISKLPREFYAQHALTVAPLLLGKLLVRHTPDGMVSGRIVEVEAYRASEDPASHAYRGPGNRNAPMFAEPGHAYIYFTYGAHHCFNVVVEPEGSAAAILVRAIEPVDGIEIMQTRRPQSSLRDLTRGPGRLCAAYGLTRDQNCTDLTSDMLYLSDSGTVPDAESICVSGRIGINVGTDLPWRFFLKDSQFVSVHTRGVPLSSLELSKVTRS